MYIQITTRCTMKCDHCCMRCEPGKGSDMDESTFIAACKLAAERGGHIFLGGGEPTLHPKLWQFVGLSLAYSDDIQPGLVTNGSVEEQAIRLANLARSGIFSVDLSVDSYHDLSLVSDKVFRAFGVDPNNPFSFDIQKTIRRNLERNDLRGVRNADEGIINVGRALDNEIGVREDCACDDLFINPLGEIFACGCQTEYFGTVFDPKIPEEYWRRDDYCSKYQDKEDK